MLKFCLFVALFVALAECSDEVCPPTADKWPMTEDCRSYYLCNEKDHPIEKCFPLLRRFNRNTLQCDWLWNVNCDVVPKAPSGLSTVTVVNDCRTRKRKLTPFPGVVPSNDLTSSVPSPY